MHVAARPRANGPDPMWSGRRRARGSVRRGRRLLVDVALAGLIASSAVVIPSSVPRAVAGPPACADTDADWLCDTAELPYGDTDGDSLPNWNDPDDDGDGIPTILELADPSDEGDPRDARDRDRDGQPDWLDAPTLPTDGWVSAEQKISDTAGGFAGILNSNDAFHVATAIGDVDGDGVVDLAVGAPGDDDGQANAGAVYVLFLNVNGTVRAEQKISDTDGGLAAVLDAGDEFGFAVAGIGDLDGDGVGELVVGVRSDDDGGSGRGAVFVLFLNADGTVRAEQKISDTAGGLVASLSNGGEFGSGVAGIGDLDGDGLPDLAVGARLGDDGGPDRGEVHVLFLNANGTVRAERKISDTAGGLVATLDDGANFGRGLAGPGDVDGDGVEDLVVGAPLGDGGGPDRGEVHVLFLNTNGTVRAEQEISAGAGGLGGLLRDGDRFGSAVAGLGDLDGDGVVDLAIGSAGDDDHGIDKGAVHLVTLTSSGSVGRRWTLSEVDGNFAGSLDDADGFGGAVTGLGDLDGDGDVDLAVGAAGDDDGGIDRGAVYVIDLTRAIDTDGDGLYDHRELLFGDTDGDSLPNWNDPDDDGDGIPTSLERADPDADGDPRDARDRDRDGQPDHRDVPTTPTGGTVVSEQKISDLVGGFSTALTNTDQFGAEVTAIGDLDRDGVVDLAVGANLDNGGGFDRGAVYVLFMNADGTVRAEQEISDVQGGLTEVIDDGDYFGRSIAALGDLDGDGIPDLAVGAPFDDDGGPDRGAIHVLFLNTNGTVRDEEKISDIDGDLTAVLDDLDLFGLAAEGIGDLDGDGIPDLAVGARNDDDGGADRGAVHVLFMNPDGTVRAEQKISDTQGGLTATLDNNDWFGVAVAALGDLDGDGIGDLAVGARNDDDGGPDTGAVHVLFMNPDGTVRAEQKISDTQGAPPTMLALDDGDWFGSGLAGLGDLDGDGRPDLAVGAWRNDDGGTDRGAVHVLTLNADGTVREENTISDTQGGLTAALDDGDQFGGSVTGLGDLDGDGTIGIAVGAFLDDDGGADRGAVYVLDLQGLGPAVVNSTGDTVDATPGDGVCWTGATNSEGDPECTLRAAIQETNAHPVIDAIHFGIPSSDPGHAAGVWTISVLGTDALRVSAPTTIDATTQPGFMAPTASFPDPVNGTPAVRIDRGGGSTILDGLWLDPDADGSVVRGLSITGFAGVDGSAIRVDGTTGAQVVGNWLGVAPGGSIDGNEAGVDIGPGSVGTVVGGAAPADRNRIVGSNYGAVTVQGATTTGTVIQGNDLLQGVNYGVVLWGGTSGNRIGGAAPGQGNRILGSWKGVLVDRNVVDSFATVLGNHIGGSSGVGIDLLTDGVTPNDAGDADTGPNDLLNFPVISSAVVSGATVDVSYSLDAPAGNYRVEFFRNPSGAHSSGHGEGEVFVHAASISHPGTGPAAFVSSFAGARGDVITATVTEALGAGSFGSTSEFSAARLVRADSDGDGLWDDEEDANADADDDPTTTPGPDTDGDSLPNWNDADDDGDGIPTSSENADPNGDGDPRDALDSDHDGQPDWLDTEAGPSSTPIANEQKISATSGGLVGPLDDSDNLGQDVTGIGDLDGDGIDDLAVGVPEDDDGGINRGAVYVLFMNANGTVRAEQKISDTTGGFTGVLDDVDEFGHGVATLGDLDGDGVNDIAVGTWTDLDGGPGRGAVWILFLERDGTVKAHRKISDTTGGLAAALDDYDRFGSSLTGVGDLDGDGTPDLAVGARWDDDGGTDRGAVYILFMNADGTVRDEQKISDTAGGLTGILDDLDEFGHDVAGIGDLDGDGIGDLAVGVPRDDDGGTDRGAVHVLLMNADGTVRAEQKLSAAAGPLAAALDDDDWFGSALAGIGDLDGNGTPDLAVGARGDTDGASNAGAVHLLRLAADGTMFGADKISATTGGLTGPLDFFDHFGRGISSLGDLDGDGTLNLAISARYDDDGGTDRGAVYVLDLAPPATAVVNSTGDAVDSAPGDGFCWTGGTNSQGRPACTLRAAIQEANGGSISSIHFEIPASDPGHSAGVWTVAPTTSLPAITAPIVLDATTQPGWTASPVIELDGSSAGAAVDGLTLASNSDGSEIRGLAIGGFSREGISILSGSDGNLIAGNHLGTDASGTVDAGNASSGIYVQSDGNTIGGTVTQDRNVISGNDGYGIYFGWTANNTVVGNHIGVDRTGNAPLGNTFNGVFVSGTGHAIGGSAAGARNVFGDHGDIAVRIESGSGHRVVGNSIGVGADGTTVLGNTIGVSVRFGATDVVIGGTAPGEGNTIRNNARGVLIHDAATDDVAVIGNAISANGDLGLDFEDDGVTANDAGDVDAGPNDLLNFPVISSVAVSGATVDVSYSLDVPAGNYRVEFFRNPGGADSSGHGEGEVFAHAASISHAGAGPAAFVSSFAGARGDVITATVTEALGAGSFGSTSEFSAAFTICGDADGDGLCNLIEDLYGDTDGDLVVNRLDPDDDGDGVVTASEHADPNGDGDPRDARDSDRDGEPDWLDGPTVVTRPTVIAEQKISDIAGGLAATLDNGDEFSSLAPIGDLDRDGVVDLVVAAYRDDDGGSNRGALYVLFMNPNGTVRAEQKISSTVGGFGAGLDDGDQLGWSVTGLGDLDGDGVGDLAAGAILDDDGGNGRGAVWILFLNANGTVKARQKISDTTGGLAAVLDDGDEFGSEVSPLGDLDGDGVTELVVTARRDDDGGPDRGAAYVLFLNTNGTVRAEQKISDTSGGLAATLVDGDEFGYGVGGLGDLDGDGIGDLGVGAWGADLGGTDRGAVYVLRLNADGTVKGEQVIASSTGGFGVLDDGDLLGADLAGIGDVDRDGVPDMVIGAAGDDDGSGDAGAVYVVSLTSTGAVTRQAKISQTSGGLTGPLSPGAGFGDRTTGIGDLDGDGAIDIAVGAWGQDDGGTDRGAVFVLRLQPACIADTDGDGLRDCEEDANTDADADPTTNPGPDTDGDSLPNWNDPDDDGDGIATALENADPNGDGDPRDARDSDRDGQPDWLDVQAGPSSTPIVDEQKISDLTGGLAAPLGNQSMFGAAVAGIGDVDRDGVVDLAVGSFSSVGGSMRGAVYVLFMNADGTVRAEQEISDAAGGLAAPLDDFDVFGHGVAGLGDLDGDGTPDLAVGAFNDDDGGTNRGAVYVLFLNPNGTVRDEQKISDVAGGLVATLDDGDRFGVSVDGIGDLDGDGVPDLVVGADQDDDGGPGRGAVYVLFLNPDGTVRAERKISDTAGSLVGVLDDGDGFGRSVGAIGDVDGDGRADLAVGVEFDDDGGADRGAVHVLFLNADGTVRDEQKISSTSGGLAPLSNADRFGIGVAGIGDLDGNGRPDLAVGIYGAGDGGSERGAVVLLRLAADGTVIGESRISANSGGLTGPLDDGDRFGSDVGGLGDLDGDGTLDIVVSARHDDDGAFDRGAVYVLDLGAPVLSNVVTVNSTGVLTDQTPGDGVCWTGGTNSEGDPECTFLAALREANDNATVDTVHFDIPTSDPNHSAGTWTITPPAASAQYTVIAPVTIDATTQPGASVNTAVAPAPMNGRLAIELSGTADDATGDWDGLRLVGGSSGSVVRGISFVEWDNATSDAILVWGSSNHVIAGNYFGVRADGVTAGVGNMAGVGIGNGGSNNRVGGTAAADRNLFASALAGSGTGWGLVWNGSATSIGNVVQGNEMGFTIGGVPTSSDANGVAVIAGQMTVGGVAPSAANRIRGGWNGVMVTDDQGPATASILGNRIWGQIDMSIDLEEDSATPNDPLDIDTGPNALLNHPSITSVDEIDGTARVSYDLDVPAGTYRIEFFESAATNPNGSGPGEVLAHVSTVTHPGGGPRSYLAAFPASTLAPVVAATATEVIGPGQFGATSEFSSPRSTVPAGSPVVDHSRRRADLDALGGADGAVTAAGNTGSAVELAGGAERLVAPTFDVTGPELSVSGWVRLDSAAGAPRLVSRTSGSTTILDVSVSGTTAIARLGFGGAPVEVTGGTITLATWHQIAAVWNGVTLTLYVDGDPVDSAAATGVLPTDPKAPLVVGNTETRDRGLDGRIDDVRVAHAARSADWIRTEYFNLTQPDQFVTLGATQTAPPGAWSATTADARTGTYALAAPVTPAGADAWATVTGIDEPGLVVEAWWRVTDPGAARVATGTATGSVPVDQFEAGITSGLTDLATQVGNTRTVHDTATFGPSFMTWTRVELRTDELGRSTALVDGNVVAGPILHSGGPSRGSAGLRAAQLTIGQAYVDDVRIRRYVSDEPTATLGPLLRQ